MTKRHWYLVGLLLTGSCLLFTGLLLVVFFVAFVVIAFSSEWTVENRTNEQLWVTPLAMSSRSPVALPNYATRFPTHTLGEVPIQPGDSANFFIDAYVESDCPALGLVIRTSEGEHHFQTSKHNKRYVIDDLSTLPRATSEMVVAWEIARQPRYFGIRLLVVATLGLGAPIIFLVLRRNYRKLNQST